MILLLFILLLFLDVCRGIEAGSKVLVLGSGGLIGKSLVKWLEKNSYQVVHVKNRLHIDLRQPHALDQFSDSNIKFVFFLACEVGGSKFIASSELSVQKSIIENNVLMYQTVFPWLDKTKIPFVFTSSYLQSSPDAYGSIKRVGEAWISTLGSGKIARLWNIYGYEPIGMKSHVIADWVGSCVKYNQILSQTNGNEERQFLHTDDCASGLGTMMQYYDQLDFVTDISSNQWISLKNTAMLIREEAPQCTVEFPEIEAVPRHRHDPDITSILYQKWSPSLSLAQGIKLLLSQYQESL